jgi:hypothetical protein
MEMSFEPARVRVNESEAREARLVRLDGAIVAVLSRVRPDEVEGESLEWHLEAGFGPCFSPAGRVFASLDEASRWITERFDDVPA